MAEKFVRSTRGVKDINKLSTNLIEETDIVSTEDGKLFIKGKDDYIEVGGDVEIPTDPRIDEIKKGIDDNNVKIKDLTSTNTNQQKEITKNTNDIQKIVIPKDINKKIKTTGWQKLTLKEDFTISKIPGEDPEYCVIDYGSHKEVFIRFGIEKLKKGKNIVANIPKEYVPYKIYRNATSTVAKIPPKVVITTSGEIEIHTYTTDEYLDTDYVIYQGSWVIIP